MNQKRVLVTPLDWGLGHATRCIPIIRTLLKFGCKIFVGGNGTSLSLLQNEFPSLVYIELPSYDPIYPSKGSMVWAMFTQLFKFKNVITKEHQIIERYVVINDIDYVISDNRYGCWSTKAFSIFITHQTNILMPQALRWFAGAVRYFNRKQILKFNQCWIPDFHDHAFSGILSKNLKVNAKFIGVLSQFSKSNVIVKKYDLLVLLSGPEPQRSIFEDLIITQLSAIKLNILFVRGIKTEFKGTISSQIKMINFLQGLELQNAIEQSELIISRSGYSTIMDLARLGKKAIFIPTPGQTEQEYLATQLETKGIAYAMTQENFDLVIALKESKKYSGFHGVDFNEEHLSIAIRELLNS